MKPRKAYLVFNNIYIFKRGVGMDLLLAIKNYCDKLIEYDYYPKTKKPSVGKLEKMADLCMDRKFRKLSRYVPKDAPDMVKEEFELLMGKIKEIVENEKNS